jgi:hypothetical protein
MTNFDQNEDDGDWLSDPFVDRDFDPSNLPPAEQQRFYAKFGIKPPARKVDPFYESNNPTTQQENYLDDLAKMLRDPRTLEEAANDSPVLAAQMLLQLVANVAAEFRRRTLDYEKSAKNSHALTAWLTKKYLGAHVDWLDDAHAAAELYKSGHWTVETLQEAYRACLDAGELTVKPGTLKQLSAREKLEVLSIAQVEGEVAALIKFFEYSAPGKMPTGDTVQAVSMFRARYPELNNQGCLHVWRILLQEPISDLEFSQFKTAILKQYPLLTFTLVNNFWDHWTQQTGRYIVRESPEELNELSTREIAARLQQARMASWNRR